MKSDLKERYIYAVTKRLPGKSRKDVARELQTLIDDMLEERCGEVIPTEKDVRVVLTELGTPAEMYEKYDNDSKKCLIGQPYYTTYKYVMKIVFICVAIGMTFASFISFMVDGEEIFWLVAAGRYIGMLMSSLLSAFAFVTALFAFFYHREIPIDSYSGLDNLPPVPAKKEEISKAESIAGIVFSVVFVILFLVCPQIFMVGMIDGEIIPIFSTEVMRSTWYIILSFGLLGIFGEIVKLIDGKYTKRVILTTVITDVISGVLAFWWLCRKDILNPVFALNIKNIFSDEEAFIQSVFGNFQYFFLGCILFALLLESITALVKWRKND